MSIKLTAPRQAKLKAGHPGIHISPEVITDCAPHIVVADLNTT